MVFEANFADFSHKEKNSNVQYRNCVLFIRVGSLLFCLQGKSKIAFIDGVWFSIAVDRVVLSCRSLP